LSFLASHNAEHNAELSVKKDLLVPDGYNVELNEKKDFRVPVMTNLLVISNFHVLSFLLAMMIAV
jgi:hypothetical protein